MILATTETLTPWLLDLPLHHCPFCLFYRKPATIAFLAAFWFSVAVPWWTLLTRKLDRTDEESIRLEAKVRKDLWVGASVSAMIGLALLLTHLMVAIA